MSNHEIPDCCVATIHERLINVLNLKQRLPDVTYLSCNNCAECYRLRIFSREPLGAEIDGAWYHAIYESIIDITREDEVQAGFQTFVIPAQPKYDGSFVFIYDHKKAEQLNELKGEVY